MCGDTWDWREQACAGAEARDGRGALPTNPCLAQHRPLRNEHQEPYEVQKEGIVVWIPRIGEQGLVLGRMRGHNPSRCRKEVN